MSFTRTSLIPDQVCVIAVTIGTVLLAYGCSPSPPPKEATPASASAPAPPPPPPTASGAQAPPPAPPSAEGYFGQIVSKDDAWGCAWNVKQSRLRDRPMSLCAVTTAKCKEAKLEKLIQTAAEWKRLPFESSGCQEVKDPWCVMLELEIPCHELRDYGHCRDLAPSRHDVQNQRQFMYEHVALCSTTEYECNEAYAQYEAPRPEIGYYPLYPSASFDTRHCQPFSKIRDLHKSRRAVDRPRP